ncbi:MAG: Flp pilus assembly protein CpaB [Anaerolineae bacterium]|jgi:Flp pilus assembly protein CpaB|nr:Flp pilus assembly protein CpaB [Anaerolineae bacterium]
MSRRVLLLLVVLAVIATVVILAFVVLPGQQGGGTTPNATNTGNQGQQGQGNVQIPPTATELPTIDIVVAVQPIGRGQIINPDLVAFYTWPEEYAPQNAITSLEDVVGKIARTDIYREQPITRLIITDTLSDLGAVGSDAAALLPPGTRMVTVPIDSLTSGAYAIQPGDRVDAIISLLFVTLDRQMQSLFPNDRYFLGARADDEGNTTLEVIGPFNGRPDIEAFGSFFTLPVLFKPSEDPRPRLTTQMTIQDALVVYAGLFPADGRIFRIGQPTPVAGPVNEATPTPETNRREGTAAPTSPPPRPQFISLAVSPQEATILVYHVEAKTPITFALRPANETGEVEVQAVTLDYILERYNIVVPRQNDFGVEPAIRSIRQLITSDTLNFRPAGQTAPPAQ